MANKVNLEITSCKQCPNWESQRYYTSDSWEYVMEWMCGLADGDRIGLVDTFDEDPEIPDWCPLLAKAKNND